MKEVKQLYGIRNKTTGRLLCRPYPAQNALQRVGDAHAAISQYRRGEYEVVTLVPGVVVQREEDAFAELCLLRNKISALSIRAATKGNITFSDIDELIK